MKKIELLEVHNRSAPMGIITETIRLLEVKITQVGRILTEIYSHGTDLK